MGINYNGNFNYNSNGFDHNYNFNRNSYHRNRHDDLSWITSHIPSFIGIIAAVIFAVIIGICLCCCLCPLCFLHKSKRRGKVLSQPAGQQSYQQGGFQLVDLIITELHSHMTCYKLECSHWWKIYL